MFEKPVIAINNRLTSLRRISVQPDELLLLGPHCLQRKSCDVDVSAAIENCRSCGKCPCANLLDLKKTYGIRVYLAGGGTEAIALASDPGVKAIIAVACAKELRAGILAAFPKPVVAICNQQPHGPCRDTDVCATEVEDVVKQLLGLKQGIPENKTADE